MFNLLTKMLCTCMMTWESSVLSRSKSICYCIHSTGCWNLMARSSCQQDSCWASSHCRLCNSQHHLQVHSCHFLCHRFHFLNLELNKLTKFPCCSNSVNIYVGIGVPWLIDTVYNFFVYQEPLYIDNAADLSFSLLVFFATSFGCITVLVLRRIILGAELGGPRLWAWVTSVYFMILWVVFVVFSSLRVSGII